MSLLVWLAVRGSSSLPRLSDLTRYPGGANIVISGMEGSIIDSGLSELSSQKNGPNTSIYRANILAVKDYIRTSSRERSRTFSQPNLAFPTPQMISTTSSPDLGHQGSHISSSASPGL